MEKTKPTPARLESLDLLRAVAILLVLGRHHTGTTVAALSEPLRSFVTVWQRGGWIGVDLFFVLSGFLISGLLFREHQRFGAIRYGHFLARRGFKIYPAFYVMLAVVLGISCGMGHPMPPWRLLWPELFFLQNYHPAILPHAWSLAVEEHFYLLLPLILIALGRRKGAPFAALPWVVAAIGIATLGVRLATTEMLPFSHKTHFFATHLRMDSLFFGVLLSWLWHYHGDQLRAFVQTWRWALGIVALGLALPPFLWEVSLGDHRYLHTFGLTALYVSAGIVLLLTLRLSSAWKPLALVGRYSYSIYLWHLPIRLFGKLWLPAGTPPGTQIALHMLVSVVFGILAALLIETPFLGLRDRFFPTRSQPLKGRPTEPAQVPSVASEPQAVAA
jgi:peptidoglycan/LPS O-acetylase OafA/YrhL